MNYKSMTVYFNTEFLILHATLLSLWNSGRVTKTYKRDGFMKDCFHRKLKTHPFPLGLTSISNVQLVKSSRFQSLSLNITSFNRSISGPHILNLFGAALPRDYMGEEKKKKRLFSPIEGTAIKSQKNHHKGTCQQTYLQKRCNSRAGKQLAEAWIAPQPTNGLTLVTDNEVQTQTPCPFRLPRAVQLPISGSLLLARSCSLKPSAPTAMEMRNPTGESRSSLPFRTHSPHTKASEFSAHSGESTLSLIGSHAYTQQTVLPMVAYRKQGSRRNTLPPLPVYIFVF